MAITNTIKKVNGLYLWEWLDKANVKYSCAGGCIGANRAACDAWEEGKEPVGWKEDEEMK